MHTVGPIRRGTRLPLALVAWALLAPGVASPSPTIDIRPDVVAPCLTGGCPSGDRNSQSPSGPQARIPLPSGGPAAAQNPLLLILAISPHQEPAVASGEKNVSRGNAGLGAGAPAGFQEADGEDGFASRRFLGPSSTGSSWNSSPSSFSAYVYSLTVSATFSRSSLLGAGFADAFPAGTLAVAYGCAEGARSVADCTGRGMNIFVDPFIKAALDEGGAMSQLLLFVPAALAVLVLGGLVLVVRTWKQRSRRRIRHSRRRRSGSRRVAF